MTPVETTTVATSLILAMYSSPFVLECKSSDIIETFVLQRRHKDKQYFPKKEIVLTLKAPNKICSGQH